MLYLTLFCTLWALHHENTIEPVIHNLLEVKQVVILTMSIGTFFERKHMERFL